MSGLTNGWVYNLHESGATSKAPKLVGVTISLTVIAVLAVVLRFSLRARSLHGLGVDDFACLFSVVSCSLNIGQHMHSVLTNLAGLFNWILCSSHLSYVASAFPLLKTSCTCHISQTKYSSVFHPETRWGQGLDAQYFPPENLDEFSKVSLSHISHILYQRTQSLHSSGTICRWTSLLPGLARLQDLPPVVILAARWIQ